jgi:hypothetical protein
MAVVGSLPTTLSPARRGFGLIRYTNNGSIDTTFVSHGGTATSFSWECYSGGARIRHSS